MKKRALIIGNGLSLRSMLELLINKSYQVAVICGEPSVAAQIAEDDASIVICGDGTLPETLWKVNMASADIAFVMFPEEDNNLIASMLCKRQLKIKKVVSILENEKKIDVFYGAGIDYVICPAKFISGFIDQQDFLNGIATLVPVSGGRVNVVEIPINKTAPVAGKKLWEIELPGEVIVSCVLRNEHSIVPRGDTRILAGDILILIASDKQEVAAVRILTGS